jgi:hypothetical protein
VGREHRPVAFFRVTWAAPEVIIRRHFQPAKVAHVAFQSLAESTFNP